MATDEAVDLMDSPGGLELVHLIGYIYIQEARKHSGAFLGIDGFFAGRAGKPKMRSALSMDERRHRFPNTTRLR